MQTAAESGGLRTVLDLEVAPGGGNMLHYHKTFDEHFTVLTGEFGVQIGTQQFTLRPGESATVPTMTLHRWYNTSTEPAMVRAELKPGSVGFERTLQICYGLAQDGLANRQGLPKNLLQLAIVIELSDTIVPGFSLASCRSCEWSPDSRGARASSARRSSAIASERHSKSSAPARVTYRLAPRKQI